ncbi:MarR family winged helix-turn-helix transcriptional regulator [Marmoricola sp. RAF53]|uniref:MarR family winged helix-turn-helix transcriptional regulator n=1 Tax=Marmoricola sp. RAF53 TaxID=3233059 RepID=UPI003F9D6F74
MSPTLEAVTRTDTGLASQLRVSVARFARRLRSEREPGNELSVPAISVLGVLIREGETTVGRLAEHERVQPPSMTRTVNALVECGYVVRRPSETDGRSVLIAISAKGRETLLADRRRRDAWLARELKTLTPDERDLLRRAVPLIERLANA